MYSCKLLAVRGERPHCCAADQRDYLSPSHADQIVSLKRSASASPGSTSSNRHWGFDLVLRSRVTLTLKAEVTAPSQVQKNTATRAVATLLAF